MRWPDLWGRPLLALAQEVLRGTSSCTVGERELLTAVVSQANACSFCVGTHSAIADRALAVPAFADWEDGRAGPAVTAAARFVVKLTQSPEDLGVAEVAATRAAGVTDAALAEAIYIAFLFNAINRVADAMEFTHHSERARIQGANMLRRMGYRSPASCSADPAARLVLAAEHPCRCPPAETETRVHSSGPSASFSATGE